MREAAGHQLLAFDEPGGYRFRHALLREAVYADLMPGERTRLHARIASLLAGVPRRRRLNSPTTAWPATTSRARSPPRFGRAPRPSASGPRPRRTATTTWPWSSGSGWTRPTRSRA